MYQMNMLQLYHLLVEQEGDQQALPNFLHLELLHHLLQLLHHLLQLLHLQILLD
jgi:hypothetical protein